MKRIKRTFIRLILFFFRLFPIKRNKIVFSSFHGSKYACNPKFIFEELQRRNIDLDMVWILPANYLDKPKARVFPEKSIRALYELATARIWIDNSRKSIWMRKRKKQYYIQTWHAGVSNKLGEKFAENMLPSEYIEAAKNDSQMADLFLSNSKWLSKNYRDCFWYDGVILEKGLPREDILMGDHGVFHSKICDFFGVDPSCRFVLYAPTFRKDANLDSYNIEYKRLLEVLGRTGEDWKLIIRLHPNIHEESRAIKYGADILNGSEYSEINELILASDVFISDYSSCMFDAMIAGCKVILYASDIAEYQSNERGFAFKWEELPFPLASDNDSLERTVLEFDAEQYNDRVKQFMRHCGFFPFGGASKAVADHIIDVINQK